MEGDRLPQNRLQTTLIPRPVVGKPLGLLAARMTDYLPGA